MPTPAQLASSKWAVPESWIPYVQSETGASLDELLNIGDALRRRGSMPSMSTPSEMVSTLRRARLARAGPPSSSVPGYIGIYTPPKLKTLPSESGIENEPLNQLPAGGDDSSSSSGGRDNATFGAIRMVKDDEAPEQATEGSAQPGNSGQDGCVFVPKRLPPPVDDDPCPCPSPSPQPGPKEEWESWGSASKSIRNSFLHIIATRKRAIEAGRLAEGELLSGAAIRFDMECIKRRIATETLSEATLKNNPLILSNIALVDQGSFEKFEKMYTCRFVSKAEEGLLSTAAKAVLPKSCTLGVVKSTLLDRQLTAVILPWCLDLSLLSTASKKPAPVYLAVTSGSLSLEVGTMLGQALGVEAAPLVKALNWAVNYLPDRLL